jgi:hypothetical protein
MPTTYTSKFAFEQGGSEINLGSGGSLTLSTGARIGGTYSKAGGSVTAKSGNLDKFKAGASIAINAGPSVTCLYFVTGTSLPGIYAGFDVPSFTAVPGSLYLRTQGSVSGPWFNFGQDTASSQWKAAASG